MYLSPRITRAVIDVFVKGSDGWQSGISAFDRLTTQERTVLQLLAEGHSTKAIADRLGISKKTVASHRERVMRKLDIHSVAGLTKYALNEGLTSPDF
jgi:DNA-binding NarL/FixJ family response regulator